MLPPPRRAHQLSGERREQQQHHPTRPPDTASTTFARPRSRFAASDPEGAPLPGAAGGPAPSFSPHPTAAAAAESAGAANNSTAPVAPRSWRDYWDERLTVPLPERRATFNVYAAGPPDASVCFLCLHGGGYTGATWSLVARALARPEEAGVGGSGGASEQQQRSYRVLAPDLRGHGLTATEDDADLSAETLREDVLALWRALAPATNPDQQQQPPPQSVVVVGHSMGGAIAVWACAAAANDVLPGLAGCVVVDVVEGTALAALPHMRAVLAARPRGFESPVDAARWALRSGACRNREAAEVSAPTQVVPASEAGEDADEQEDDDAEEEEDEADDDGPNCRPPPRFVWRTPLAASSRFWEGWYRGLSAAFLERLPAGLPRMLIAAGAERLDRALTVGQMQGKFQLLLVAGSGHAVQEDCPLVVSGALSQLARRFRIGEPPMRVPLPAAGGGRVLPVVAGPLLPAFGAAARRAPGGTAAAAAGVARVGGASFGAVEEEEEEEENEAC